MAGARRPPPAGVRVRAMTAADHADAAALWRHTPGIGLNESDREAPVAAFLARNPGMSAVARDGTDALVGTLLCGHDGRRGYLHHLAVDESWRGRGVAAALLAFCTERLRTAGIPKCNVFLFADNEAGARFWTHAGFRARSDLHVHQRTLAGGGDA